ncbi:MAG: hypothetical protein ACRBCJ_13625 [Hyphomicrobiaceae bacterium]
MNWKLRTFFAIFLVAGAFFQPHELIARSDTAHLLTSSASVSVEIKFPDGSTKKYSVPISKGMTVVDVMKTASGIKPSFKWNAVWFENFWSFQITEIDGVKNEKYVNEDSKFWQYCAGPAGFLTPSSRGVNLFGVAPNDAIVWEFVKSGGLSCK